MCSYVMLIQVGFDKASSHRFISRYSPLLKRKKISVESAMITIHLGTVTMKYNIFLSTTLVACSLCTTSFALAEDSLKSVFSEGNVSGNIRAYYNTRTYSEREDESGFALGGALNAETGSFGWMKLGVTYYTAQDLDLNSDDAEKVNGRLGEDLETLGEAYIQIEKDKFSLKSGRQIINSPFANAGDAFITPFTFSGYAFDAKLTDNFSVDVDYISTIRNRNSNEFVDVGDWSTNRFGIFQQATGGTLNLGAKYKTKGLNTEIWYTQFDDLFNTIYLNGYYAFPTSGSVTPFVGVQYITQSDSGDTLLGTVDSTLTGLQGGATFGKAKLTLAYNDVSENDESFRNGAFLTPYTFSTSPLFTNNMIGTLENVDAGSALKATFNYAFSQVKFKLSYATLDYASATDRESLNVDMTYSFNDYLKGLSLRYRLEVMTADVETNEVTNHRLQAQFAF